MEYKYEEFNLTQLNNYVGDNPFILEIEKKYRTCKNYTPTPFENEYLIKNFKLHPHEFKLLEVEIGDKTKERIKLEYNIDKVSPIVKLDSIVGETDEWYHVKCTMSGGREVYFWLYKKEVGNLYEKNYTRISVDFDSLNRYFEYTLYDYQETGVQFLLHNKRCFLLDDMGSGKTHTSIAATINNCKKVLIVCQHGKQIDWQRELQRWGQKSKIIWTGKIGWDDSDVKYTIIGNHVMHKFHESKTKKKKNEDLYRPLEQEEYDCIIVDEMQFFKNPKSNRSKVLNDLCCQSSVEYVWAMSGTLIEKNEEFYNVCRILNVSINDLILSANDFHYLEWFPAYEDFLRRYCGGHKIVPRNGKRSFWVRQGNTNTEELHQRVKHLMRRRITHKSHKDFPDKFEDQLFYKLTLAQQKKYDKLFNKFLIDEGILDEHNKLLQKAETARKNFETGIDNNDWKMLAKLRKISEDKQKEASDFYDKWIKLENLISASLTRQFLALKKIPHTVNFIKHEIELGNNTIIFTNFIEELEKLAKDLEKSSKNVDGKIVVIRGGLAAGKKQALIDEYMDNDEKFVLIGNIESIGTGFNITKADNIYFNSLPWRSDVVKQGIARSWRIGRKYSVNVWYPTFENTFEEEVYRIVTSKSENRDIFHGDM